MQIMVWRRTDLKCYYDLELGGKRFEGRFIDGDRFGGCGWMIDFHAQKEQTAALCNALYLANCRVKMVNVI
jgi:hypothetical protein